MRLCLAAILALAAIHPAGAQTAVPTPGTGAAPLVVLGCLDGNGNAVPCPQFSAGASVTVSQAAPVQTMQCPPNPISKKTPPLC